MSIWIIGVLAFLGVSLLFYVLLGGADFGAGILELFLGSQRKSDQQKLISHAIAPVWEANHIWLIIAIVILFMGFPKIYTTVSVYLYLPILALLLGIVARGCTFTFRYYDTLGKSYYPIYSKIFAISSLWASFFIGVIAGAMILGRIDPQASNFYSLFISPWFNGFCFTLGAFTSALFAFLAAIYLIGETSDMELKEIFRNKATFSAFSAIFLGFIVFGIAEHEDSPFAQRFFSQPFSLASFFLATFLWIPFWKNLSHPHRTTWTRILGAAIVSLVLLGWYSVQFPFAIQLAANSTANQGITFLETAAPEATLRVLLGALVIGSFLIFPALGYLFKIFSRR
jgi:cytochrome bd ubiquinol oxidase subunit II